MARRRAAQDWPVPPEQGAIRDPAREQTLVAEPPPAARRWYDDHLALGLGAILVLLLVAAGAAGAAYYLHHRHRTAAPVTTVVVTTHPAKTATAAATPAAMPPLVGLSETQALARLRQYKISATVVKRPASRPPGTVIAQRPAQATAVGASTPVTIVVATGVTKVAVPNFVGQPVAQARAALQKLGLRSTTTAVTGAGKPAGTVVDQAPKPGANVTKDRLVTLSVAKASPKTASTSTSGSATTATTTAAPAQPQTASVPDVSGQTEAAAVQAFVQAGIEPSLVFVSAGDPLGTVEAQAKPAGTTVPYRSHVQINVSEGANPGATEHVPNVVGRTLQQALAAINAAHLKMIYVKIAVPRSQAGKIAQQSPLAGGGAPENAQVLVFLGVYKP
jgi:beta-lactam-binding protein with PASTA domain